TEKVQLNKEDSSIKSNGSSNNYYSVVQNEHILKEKQSNSIQQQHDFPILNDEDIIEDGSLPVIAGRPNIKDYLLKIKEENSTENHIGVMSCGPWKFMIDCEREVGKLNTCFNQQLHFHKE